MSEDKKTEPPAFSIHPPLEALNDIARKVREKIVSTNDAQLLRKFHAFCDRPDCNELKSLNDMVMIKPQPPTISAHRSPVGCVEAHIVIPPMKIECKKHYPDPEPLFNREEWKQKIIDNIDPDAVTYNQLLILIEEAYEEGYERGEKNEI